MFFVLGMREKRCGKRKEAERIKRKGRKKNKKKNKKNDCQAIKKTTKKVSLYFPFS